MEGTSNRKRKKNEDWQPKQPKRPHLEENTLTETTVGKEQASDTDESTKMLHLEQNSAENDRGSNNPGRPVIFKVGIYCIAIIIPSPTKLQRDIVTLPSVRPSVRPSVLPSVRSSFRNILVNTLGSTSFNGFYQTWYIFSP